MSPKTSDGGRRESLGSRTFALRSRLDDPVDPELLTITPAEEESTTKWLTIDAGFVVDLDEML